MYRKSWIIALVIVAVLFTHGMAAVITIHDSFNPDDWHIGGPVQWVADSSYLQLTDHTNFTSSRVYTLDSYEMDQFTAEFDFKIGGGSGADGIVFGWVNDYNYPVNNALGGLIDFDTRQDDAFGVEIDCYYNSEYHDADGQHVALIHENTAGHLSRYSPPDYGSLENGKWHHMIVANNNGLIYVYLDDTLRINYQINDYSSFQGHFGFTAGTGAANNYHIIKNVTINQGVPEPGELTITYPNGGEYLYADSTLDVQWDDNTGSDHYTVFGSEDGGATWGELGTVNAPTHHFSFVIPAEVASVHCLVKVVGYDADNEEVAYDVSDAYIIVNPYEMHSPVFYAGWWLVSVPLNQPNPLKGNVIGDDIPGIWDWYQFNYNTGYWRPDSAVPGPGYWLAIAHDTCTLDVYGPANTDTVTYDLVKSWNIIGDPFPTVVPLSTTLFRYQDTTYSQSEAVDKGLIVPILTGCTPPTGDFQTNTLSPWFGYWFMCLKNDVEMLVPPPVALMEPVRDQAGTDPEEYWQVHITASSELGVDNIASIGACEVAKDGFDPRFDFPRPSPRGDYVMVYSKHDDWINGVTRYSNDIRARLNDTTTDYDIYVQTSAPAAVTLRWDDLKLNTTPEFAFTLIDPATEREINMSEADHYDLQVGADPYPLIVKVYGPPLDVKSQPAPLLATNQQLLDNYPNPFNPATHITYTVPAASTVKITVFDIAGKLVTTLVDGYQPAGSYTVDWNAIRNSNGVYLVRLDGNGFSAVKKVVLMK